jgi:dynein heavy chain
MLIKFQEDLRRKNVAVARLKASGESTLSKMGAAREEADAQAKNADIERAKVDKAEQEASHLQQQASSELANAQPALEAAREAVAQVTKELLAELKALTRLPTGCDKVAAALLMILKNEKRDFGWENARKMMAKVDSYQCYSRWRERENEVSCEGYLDLNTCFLKC